MNHPKPDIFALTAPLADPDVSIAVSGSPVVHDIRTYSPAGMLPTLERPHHPGCNHAIAEFERAIARLRSALAASSLDDVRKHLRVAEACMEQAAIALDKAKQQVGL